LVVGQGSVESELAVLAFLGIKEQVRSNPALFDIFKLDDFQVLEKIKSNDFHSFYTDWNG
jgi:hypothetical protein